MGPEQLLPVQASVVLGVMAMKEYFTNPKILEMKPHHQMKSHIQDIRLSPGVCDPFPKSWSDFGMYSN